MRIVEKILHKSAGLAQFEIMNLTQSQTIPVRYFNDVKNWGDYCNVDVIGYLSKKKIINCPLGHRRHLLGIGSVLVASNKKSVIWGSGFISQQQKINSKPLAVCAVRGPLSRQKLLEYDIDCPSIFGDPALLVSEIYPELADVKKKYRIGIVPHYDHINEKWINDLRKDKNVNIINIKTNDTIQFLTNINSCHFIASSSLHGIIAADAYKIPNCRLIIDKMNKFKFDDYHQGVGVYDYPEINIHDNAARSLDEVIAACEPKEINFQRDKLVQAFPYAFFS